MRRWISHNAWWLAFALACAGWTVGLLIFVWG